MNNYKEEFRNKYIQNPLEGMTANDIKYNTYHTTNKILNNTKKLSSLFPFYIL